MSIPALGFVGAALFLLMGQTVLGLLIFVLFILWPAWITLSTNYSIRGEFLYVRFGPLRYRIRIEEIHQIEARKTLKFGPALSWDKLCLTYGANNKKLYISPADKYTFVYDLGIGGEENYSTLDVEKD